MVVIQLAIDHLIKGNRTEMSKSCHMLDVTYSKTEMVFLDDSK
jgi:hypothetical protein